jgi:hypothetical protein
LLYVLIEGWRELRHDDPDVNRLLGSPNVDLLRRFRNGTFHFQKSYFDARFTEFWFSETEAIVWADEIHNAFDAWFLRRAELAGIKLEVVQGDRGEAT